MITDKEIAYEHLPHVIHGIGHEWKDRITEIFFSDVPKDKKNAVAFIHNLPMNVYFEVVHNIKCDSRLLIYNYFHRKDFSLNKIGLIEKYDSHDLDFEGVVKCISPENEVLWTCTRSHYQLLFQKGDSVCVYIEPEGHAIKPDNGFRGWQNQEVLDKTTFNMVDMKANWKHFHLHIYPVFRKFKIDQWRDWGDTRLDRKFGRVRMAGLLERNPDKFYKYALNRRIVKGV